MRKTTNKGSFISEYDPMIGDTFYGVSTGFEFCSEHEWGIKILQESAGIKTLKHYVHTKKWFGLSKVKPIFGLDRTTILNTDNITQGIFDTDNGKYYLLAYNLNGRTVPDDFTDDFNTYWDDTCFIIISNNKEKMTALTKAAYNKDLAFTTGGKILTDHAGIRLVIKSKTPTSIKDQCLTDDRKNYELMLLDKKIDIRSKLNKAKCEYYACSPRWKDYDKKEIHWWLNPKDQNSINSEYFTQEELIEWTKGKGTCIKIQEND